MNSIKKHQGISLFEVLVSLLLLAVGVLGYVALQVRAVEASSESLNRSQAIFVLRGLAESMRANQAGQAAYPAAVNTYISFASATAPTKRCFNDNCTATELAGSDAYDAARFASALGVSVAMSNCPGTGARRQCLFAGWGNTTFTVAENGTVNYSKCMTTDGVYLAQSTCLMMEAY